MTECFAATMLQPFGGPLVLALAAGMAYYGFKQGLFLATIAGLHALIALLGALGLAGAVADWLLLAEVPRAYALPGGFFGVLIVLAVGIRLAVGAAVPPDTVRLAPKFDKVAGGIVGAVAGLVIAGAVLIGFSIAPVPPAYRIDGSKMKLDMGSRMLRTFVRCVAADETSRRLLLEGEPGTPVDPAAKQRPPAWSEPFVDANGSLTYDDGEHYIDTDGNGSFTKELKANDLNGDGRRDVGLLERYRSGHWEGFTAVQAPKLTSKDVAYVTEHAPVETVVHQVTATDVDPGDVLTYSLKPDQPDDASLVSIDSASGAIVLKSPADREIRKNYQFTVVVTDKAGLTDEQVVTVNVVKKRSAEEAASPGLTPQP
jgi:hypothetical protein